MSKIKIGFSALLTLIMLSMFAALASAEEFTPTPTNPAPGINVGTVDNFGQEGTHKTHGNFQNNTNSCANCHSTHNGENTKLVKYSSVDYELCTTCHDGTLGFYSVFDQGAGAGTFNDKNESSSMHHVESGLNVSAAPGNTKGGSEKLQCSSCHNPHGSTNDRLLKNKINGVDIATIKLEMTEDPDAVVNGMTASGLKVMKSKGPLTTDDQKNYSILCSACHDDYLASRSGGKPSKPAKHGFTHTTNGTGGGKNCASCHYAHGTDITLLKDTGGRTIADLVKNEGWSEDTAKKYMQDVSAGGSNLKKYTNMAVCWSCHQSTKAIDTPPVAGGKYVKPTR